MGEEVKRGQDDGEGGRGSDDCCQRLNQINIFVLFSFCCGYFFPVWFLFFFPPFSACVRAKRGRAFGWCDKAAGGNLISFSVYFSAAFCFACFSLSESETEAQINKTFSAVVARLKINEFLVKIPDSHFTFRHTHTRVHTNTHTRMQALSRSQALMKHTQNVSNAAYE